jgi:ribonuclease BN (tRNA processing enzyme)
MNWKECLLKTLLVLAISLLQGVAAYSQAPADPAFRSEFVTLGTGGGPTIRKNRSQPANAIVINKSVYLFDVGAGTERQLVSAGLSIRQVQAIFISHHHIDHDADLGQLAASRWMFRAYKPLPVIGPPGTRDMTGHIIASLGPVELAPIGATTENKLPSIVETVAPIDLAPVMDVPTEVYRDENIRVLAVTNSHYHYAKGSREAESSRSYSFRIEAHDRVYVYTGDTGPSENVERLARGADVLVSEVIDLEKTSRVLKRAGMAEARLASFLSHMEEDHLTPDQIEKLAAPLA